MFSPRNFTATGLMFKPLIHFELVFVSDIRQRSNVIFLHVVILFIPTQEKTIISPLDDTVSLIKLEFCMCGLYMDYLFFIGLCGVYLYASDILFELL